MAASKRSVRKQVHPNSSRRVRKTIADIADADTPEDVKIDSSTLKLFIWAVGRFGIGVVFAYMTYVLYQDQRTDQQRLYEIIIESNRIMKENSETMNGLRRAIEQSKN